MVSAWASQNRLVLGQVKVDAKSNEITAIPELLKVLELHAAILIMRSASVSRHFKLQTFEHEGQQMIPIIKANVTG